MSTKLKPFDLEAALRGEPVVTRDGRQAKVAGVNHDAKTLYKIVGWLDGIIVGWCIDGKNLPYGEDPRDLFMATKTVKKEGWVVIRNANIDIPAFGQSIFNNKAAAQDYADKRGYGIVTKIEWEEEV